MTRDGVVGGIIGAAALLLGLKGWELAKQIQQQAALGAEAHAFLRQQVAQAPPKVPTP